jgi:hypothetical protein
LAGSHSAQAPEPAFRLSIRRNRAGLGLFSQAIFDEFRELSSGC